MFVKHGCPQWQQSQNMAKISKSYIFTPTHPQGHVMSVKCEEPIDGLTVKVWLLYHHPNFKYCTLFVSGTELRTDKWMDGRTDRRTDRWTIRLLDAPMDLLGRGHKNCNKFSRTLTLYFFHHKNLSVLQNMTTTDLTLLPSGSTFPILFTL